MGAVMQQRTAAGWRPLAFFSRQLSATQQQYSTLDRKLTAAFQAFRHFRFLLEGRKFTLITDHKPLVATFACARPAWSARQQRQLSYISGVLHRHQAHPWIGERGRGRPVQTCLAAATSHLWGQGSAIWSLPGSAERQSCNTSSTRDPSRRHPAIVI
jgi:hypothetical protein